MRKNLIWTLKQLHLSLEQYGKILLEDMELSPIQCILLHYLLSRRGQDIYGADLHATLAKAFAELPDIAPMGAPIFLLRTEIAAGCPPGSPGNSIDQ